MSIQALSRTLIASLVCGASLLASDAWAQARGRCRVTDVTVQPSETAVPVGQTFQFTATGYRSDGQPCDDTPNFAWNSDNQAVATIDASGLARAISTGTVRISARTGAGATLKVGYAVLTVEDAVATESARTSSIPDYVPLPGRPTTPGSAAFHRQPDGEGPAEGLLVDPLTLPLVRGEWRPLSFRAMRGTENAARVPILFTVDPGGERLVAVDSLGLVTSLGDTGVATVRLTIPGQTRIQAKTVRVEVRGDPLRFNKFEFSLAPGQVETLSVYIQAQGRPLNNPEMFQFSSTDSTRVRVNPLNPIVTAVSAGVARITVQGSIPYPPFHATVRVHDPVASVRIEPDTNLRIIAVSATSTVRATPLAENGQPVRNAPLTWTVRDTNVVRYDTATGTITGRRAGLTEISVTVPTSGIQSITRSVAVRVVPGALALPAGRARFGMGIGETMPLTISVLDDQRRPLMPANPFMTWTVTPDSVLRVDGGNQIVATRPGRARLTGRARWDTTVTMDIFVVGDLLVAGQNQGRRDLLWKWNTGQNWAPLTSDSASEQYFTWSQDLTRIAYSAQPSVQQRVPSAPLYVMQADGTGRVRVVDDSSMIRFPSFSPAGDRLYYESNRGGRQQVWMVELRGDSAAGPPRMLTVTTPGSASYDPALSRDGRRLAYVSVRDIPQQRGERSAVFLANQDGMEERLRTFAARGQRIYNPQFSADGQTLFFIRSEEGRPPGQRVFRLPVDGQPTDSAVAVTPAGIFVTSFSVSGDGQSLAIATQEPAQGRNEPVRHVLLFSLQTGTAQALGQPEERLANPVLRPATPRPPATATPPR